MGSEMCIRDSDEADGYAAGEVYLPDELSGTQFYQPVERGLEIKIKQKLDYLRQLDTNKTSS